MDVALTKNPAYADVRRRDDSRFVSVDAGGWVYFIRAGLAGPIKIGRSHRPHARLDDLQASSAEQLELLLAIDGGAALERELHERFAAHRLRGEWFAPAPALLHYIRDRMKPTGNSTKRKLPVVLSQDEVRRLLEAPSVRYPTGLRNRCMLELMYRAGLRVGEVCALRPRDVEISAGIVRIWDGKTGDGTAYFDSDTLRVLLEQWKAVRRALPKSTTLFCTLKGGQVSVRYMEQMFQRMRARAKIETRCTPHTLRHTFATELLSEGFNIREVQEALRHADVSTTQLYTHIINSDLRTKIQQRRR